MIIRFESERAQLRVLSNVFDAQGIGHVRDLLRQAESEIREWVEHREKTFCTTDCGDGSTIYDTRPRA